MNSLPLHLQTQVDHIISLMRQTDLDQAETQLRRLQQEHPEFDSSFLQMLLWAHQGKTAQAYSLGRQLFEKQSHDANLRFYLARLAIDQGQWLEGLELFDSIRGVGPFGGPLLTQRRPLWDGLQSLIGKTIFLASEGGLGDAICFARFAKNFSQLGAKVILGTYEPLFPLFKNIPGIDTIVDIKAIDQCDFDFWVPSLSAPRLLGLAYESIDGRPYIHLPIDPSWSQLTTSTKPKIGLVWQGNPQFAEDYLRSIAPQLLLPLLDLEDYEFFTIHRSSDPHHLEHPRLKTLGEHINDPTQLAQFLMQMDLVISIDSGPAHLAGALGVPTLLLNRAMGWFTFAHSPNTDLAQPTPWYDCMAILHQKRWGQWPEVISRAVEQIKKNPLSPRQPLSSLYHPLRLRPAPFNAHMVSTQFGPTLVASNDFFVGKALEIYGEYSQAEVDLFYQVIQPGAVVLEGGSHLGAHTSPLAEIVGCTGKVYAFEAQPFLASLLRANMALQNRSNVIVANQALDSSSGTIELPVIDYTQLGNFGALELHQSQNDQETVRIEKRTIDSLNLEKLDFLKLDVEGMEQQILLGAQNTIKNLRPVLYVENDRNNQELIKLLQGWNYELRLHNPLLFNEHNFNGVKNNIYLQASSFNILALPREKNLSFPDLPRLFSI